MRRSTAHVLNPHAIAAFAIGVTVTIAAVVLVGDENEARTRDWLIDQGRAVAASTENTFDEVIGDLRAVAAFVELSDDISAEAFRSFVTATEPEAGFLGIAYIDVVAGSERPGYEAAMRRASPGFELWELDGIEPLLSPERAVHLPVVFFTSTMTLTAADDPDSALTDDEPLGFDAASLSASEHLLTAIDEPGPAVSEYIEIPELTLPGRAIVLHAPVHGPDGEVDGFVVAASIEPILVPLLASGPVTRDVSWEIGPPGSISPTNLEWRTPIDIAGRRWEVVVTPTDPALASQHHLSTTAVILVGAAFTLLLIAAVALYRLRTQARLRAETLERLAEEKSRFIATVSHELRTPLTSVSGLVSELHDRWGDFDREEAVQLLGLAKSEALAMAGIVEDLLVAARLEEAQLTFLPELIDVSAECLAAAAGTGVDLGAPDPGVTAYADPTRVRQIIRNLLTNAVRYGGERIEVVARSVRGLAVLDVLDDGPPIPKEDRDRIFEPFTSAHHADRAVESIGMGLFISRKLALSMGGDLAYEHDGTWSRFRLILPTRGPSPTRLPGDGVEPEPALAGG